MYYTVNRGRGPTKVNNAGVFQQILDNLNSLGGMRNAGTFNDEILKIVLDRLTKKYNIDVLFHSFLFGAKAENGKIEYCEVVNKSGIMKVYAKIFVDGTGDADLAHLSNCQYQMGRDGDGMYQPMTHCFRLADVNPDHEDLRAFPHVLDTVLHFNATHVYNNNPLNVFDLTAAEMEGREQAYAMYMDIKAKYRGYENSKLLMTGAQIGVRETRRIVGTYVLTEQDLWNCKKFEDSIARGCYGVDIHDPKGKTENLMQHLQNDDYYTIPYRCLVPLGVSNLLVTGRPISSTHEAHSAIRVLPICTSIGHGAGIAAFLAASKEISPQNVDAGEIQHYLTKQEGVY
jgi:hypothetical protein